MGVELLVLGVPSGTSWFWIHQWVQSSWPYWDIPVLGAPMGVELLVLGVLSGTSWF